MMRPLALTLGEPAGIGPDIALAAWRDRRALALPPFYVIADADFLARRAAALDLAIPISAARPEDAAAVFDSALPVENLAQRATASPGRPDMTSAPVAIASLRAAAAAVLAGRACAMVTNPVAKNVLYRSGFSAPGQTEFLASLASEATGKLCKGVMMLWSPQLAVVPVTIHLPLAEVAQRINEDLIVETARVVAADLRDRFAILAPRIAVAGLNPHAGEGGFLGHEDDAIVRPAIARIAAAGIDVRGPLPADTMFHPAARAKYDVALCMYHDQALIPIKTLSFDSAVNVTLGLPFVRTSPDHGTAFDIAGTGRASPASLVAAIRLAHRLGAGKGAAAIAVTG
ncbi:MAG: 4-hydroxythreonine-4-phosphate dehydrogenase PdxA [Proteobacteria bacterium]|nr:4-hydroxythreonine-4-phosphate dehydrogenase PdxA [Pseudomonadota bacterium]